MKGKHSLLQQCIVRPHVCHNGRPESPLPHFGTNRTLGSAQNDDIALGAFQQVLQAFVVRVRNDVAEGIGLEGAIWIERCKLFLKCS